jgi:hypothetical protein
MGSQLCSLPQSNTSTRITRGKGLVIFPGALGDFLCFMPTLRCLSEDNAGSDLEIVMQTQFGGLLFKRTPPISVRSLDCREISRLFVSENVTTGELRKTFQLYDFIYSWMGITQPDFVRNLRRLAVDDFRIFPFRPSQSDIHMEDYYLSCLGKTAPVESFPRISLRANAVSWVRRFWQQNGLRGDKILAIAPGSGASRFASSMRYLFG